MKQLINKYYKDHVSDWPLIQLIGAMIMISIAIVLSWIPLVKFKDHLFAVISFGSLILWQLSGLLSLLLCLIARHLPLKHNL